MKKFWQQFCLTKIWQNLKKSMKGGQISPCLDGRFVVGTGAELLKAGKQKQIPYMAGCTSEDMMPPILFGMAKDWCAAQSVSSYGWYFDRQLPGDDNGAWHSSDLWYWFGTLENCWRPMTRKDRELSDQMTDYLVNFCKFGDPNGAGLTAWLPVKGSGQVMMLGEEAAHMGKPSLLKMTRTMLTNKAVGE